MTQFSDYLHEVQLRSGLLPRPLIRSWLQDEIDEIERLIVSAVERSGAVGSAIPNFAGSNQSKGNQAEEFFIKIIKDFLPGGCKMDRAKGSGYPDRILQICDASFCLEMKATAHWNDKDDHRRVLTSSPKKLINLIRRGLVSDPPAHLLCSILYIDDDRVIAGVRLDFLDPTSTVRVRLEASTTQKLLVTEGHKSLVFAQVAGAGRK